MAVDPPTPSAADLPACTALVDALPDTLPRGESTAQRRAVSPESGLVAAWGSPPVVLRCGVAPPEPLATECVGVDGVDWVLEERADGYVFRTYGREPTVEVTVPGAYAPEVNPLVPLAPVVAAIPQGPRCA